MPHKSSPIPNEPPIISKEESDGKIIAVIPHEKRYNPK